MTIMITTPSVNVDNKEALSPATKFFDASDDVDDAEEDSMFMVAVLTVIYLCIFVIGLIGNSLVITVIIKDQKMRSVANFFLVSLSVADLMILLFCLPVAVYELHMEAWIFGSFLCKLSPYLQYLSVNASILTMLAISFERLFVIRWPLKARSYCTKRHTVYVIVSVWFVCAMTSFPSSVIAVAKDGADLGMTNASNLVACVNETAGFEWYVIFEVIVFYICPGCLLFVVYALIIVSLRKSSDDLMSGANSRRNVRKRESRQQLIVMLGSVVIAYFICLLPFNVVVITAVSSPATLNGMDGLEYTVLLSTSRLLFFVNSCINPILYNAISGKFRSAFVRLFKFKSDRSAKSDLSMSECPTYNTSGCNSPTVRTLSRMSSQQCSTHVVNNNFNKNGLQLETKLNTNNNIII